VDVTETIYMEATGCWTGAAWTHERTDPATGRVLVTRDGDSRYCEGGELDLCQTCQPGNGG